MSAAKIAVAHQPNWFPRLKTLCKIAAADVWVVLDDVQYVSREWQNRCRVHPLRAGQPRFWLTAPVIRPGGRTSVIREVTIADPVRTGEHVRAAVRHAYRTSRYWAEVCQLLEAGLGGLGSSLAQAALDSALTALHGAGATPRWVPAAELAPPGPASSRLATACVGAGVTHYLAGPGSRAYLAEAEFDRRGVAVLWQDFTTDLAGEPAAVQPAIGHWSYLDFVARFGLAALGRLLAKVRTGYHATGADSDGSFGLARSGRPAGTSGAR